MLGQTTIAPGANGTVSVSCNTDEKALSGGWEAPPFNGANALLIANEDKKSNSGWTASATNLGPTPGQLTVYAHCLEE